MSDQMKSCPKCDSPYGYPLDNDHYACPECDHLWNSKEEKEVLQLNILDANGNVLTD